MLPSVVCEELQQSAKRVRRQYSDDTVKFLTDQARQVGTASAIQTYNRKHPTEEIAESTVRTWLSFWRKNNTYFSANKRGRHSALTEDEMKTTMEGLQKLRSAPSCAPLTAGTVAAVARGIVATTRPAALLKHGGSLKLTSEWAKKQLRKEQWAPLARTSDRTVPDEDIVAAAPSFFEQLSKTGAPRDLVLNLDEFAVLLGPNRKWTWQPVSQRRSVAIRDTKEAFTCCVVTSAAGVLLELQMIWKGSTDLVHAHPDVVHPKIKQDHQPDSHFQNAHTFARLLSRIAETVKQIRIDKELPDASAVLIVDAAGQHSVTSIVDDAGITVVEVPKKQTHIFQPADQYVIAGLKAKAAKAWDDFVESLFAANSLNTAVAELTISSKPILRKRMYSFLARAVDELGTAAVVSSWAVTGISRAMWGDVPVKEPVIDTIVTRTADFCECGLRGCRRCERCEDWVCASCWTDHDTVFCKDL